MATYSRFLAGLFPNYYFRRTRALSFQAAYDAEKPTRNYRRKMETRGPNQTTEKFNKVGRDIVREMEQNSDMVSGALDVMCANIVGGGIIPEPLVLDNNGDAMNDLNEQLSDLHRRWRRQPEVTWEYDEATAQRLACRTWIRDGECLARHHVGVRQNLNHGTAVPYSYELIEPEFLVTDDRLFRGGTRHIVQGVELGGWRRPVAYHFYREHPTDGLPSRRVSATRDTVRVDAKRVTHLKITNRINQVRGITKFATVIKRLNDIGEIDETERVAARVAAAFSAVIIKGDPQLFETVDADSKEREMKLRPGMIFDDLLPGESVQSLGSNRPNNDLIPFRASQLRAGASGIGISYSSWAKDYNGTYSSQRQELTEQHRLYTPVWGYFVERFEQKKWENFVRAADLAGLIDVGADVNMETLFDAIWTQPAMPWIQPLQEANAWKVLKEIGVETTTGINRMRGKNPRDIERQRKMEDEADNGQVVLDDPEESEESDDSGNPNIRRNRLGHIS